MGYINVKFPPIILSYLAGILFITGWWLWIDAHINEVYNRDQHFIQFKDYVPSILNTLALIVLNMCPPDRLSSDDDLLDGRHTIIARIWVFACFAVFFGSMAGATWIMGLFVDHHSDAQWPPGAVMLQNLMIFAGAILLWVARAMKHSKDDEFMSMM
eukprot:gb/GECH01009476.1/.p1 GENE.gb/GECH01009476.1/~~gb/GECH01009476.1/.p1  ORF type:complete len:157 (+),score=32.58 gb/GECH01009476.1/:1-471(+)